MKKLIILCLGLVAAVAPLSAQDHPQPPAFAPGMGGGHGKKHGNKQGPPGADLTPDERQRLDAARGKANEDPTVRSLVEAKKSLDEQLESAMRAAILATDPSLAPTLEKIKAARDRAKEMKGKFESLTPEQKQQLKAARETAKNDPAVQAARENLRDAQGPEAKRDAARAMHEAMKAAMLKADPSLGALLEKLGPDMMGGGPRHGHGPGERGPGGPPRPDMDGPPGEPGFE